MLDCGIIDPTYPKARDSTKWGGAEALANRREGASLNGSSEAVVMTPPYRGPSPSPTDKERVPKGRGLTGRRSAQVLGHQPPLVRRKTGFLVSALGPRVFGFDLQAQRPDAPAPAVRLHQSKEVFEVPFALVLRHQVHFVEHGKRAVELDGEAEG
jgi:hypothetical protein